MKVQDLYYFRKLAQTRSFTETADSFYVSQPSISTALKRLEEEFGTRLISRDRSSRSVRLTEAGDILYKNAQAIILLLEQTKKEIRNRELKEVKLGFLPTIGSHFLPKLLPEVSEYVSALNLIEEESSDVMYDMIQSGEISVAITALDQPYSSDDKLTYIPLAEKELFLWVSPEHPLASQTHIKPHMLDNVHFVTLAKGYAHERLFCQWAKTHQVDVSNTHYAQEVQTVNSMIASGMSAGVMIDLLVRDRCDLVKIPLDNAPRLYISLVINHDADITDIQKEFNKAMVEAANSFLMREKINN
ncbi:MAG: LysR family transcriptional regulator [Alkalibacterium sp.]|nr:LysR family transcriptional regulator [Alkalibacterium sp.]